LDFDRRDPVLVSELCNLSSLVSSMSFFQKLGSFLSITAAVVVGLAITNWGTINKYRVQSDLRDFGRSVRKATISLSEKERLLDVIERLDDKIEQGEQFGWLDWSRHNETAKEILHGGLDHDKVRLLEREMLRVEKHLTDGD
jgi:hypothetical protein